MKKLLFLLLIGLATLVPLSTSNAQTDGDTVGLAISPAIVEVGAQPGSTQETIITLTNNSDRAIPLKADSTSLIPIDNEIDQSRRAEFDASSWVKINQENILLEPGEATPIKVSIEVPKEANPGGHYAQVGFRVLEQASFNQAANAEIIPEISAALFISTPGDVIEKAEFNTSNIISKYVSKNSERKLEFTMSNFGNTHILPAPKVVITKNNQVVKELHMQPQLVLPNTYKKFSVDWPADVAYGRYQVHVETVYGNQNIPLTSDLTNFTVGPAWWQILVSIGFITPLLILGLRHKNLSNVFKVLSGRRIHLVSKNRYSKAQSSDKNQKVPETIGDYTAISQFLGDEKPQRMLTTPPEMQPKVRSAEPIEYHSAKPQETIAGAMTKQAQKPLSTIKESPKATVTEVSSQDNPDKKTVIVQTSASTIVRQEPKVAADVKIETPIPTIVRSEVAKPVIKINVFDEPSIIRKDDPPEARIKPRTPLTRSEQIAKKASAAAKKAAKKKV